MKHEQIIITQISKSELSDIIDKSVLSALIKRDRIVDNSNQILSAKQAAEFLDISLPTLHKWKRKGMIPFHQKGGRIFFKKSELIKSL